MSDAGTSKNTGLRSRLAGFVALLKPLENGPREIRALDGLRAVAALLIVIFHGLHYVGFQSSSAAHGLGNTVGNFFWYMPTGVHLFFVLSGFLLFLPFARTILNDQPLPGFFRFFQKRALRILPAYLVVLSVLVWLPTADHTTQLPVHSYLAHLVFIQDMFPDFNRDLEGPFWTLAVEVQFYIMLPFIAAALARFVGGTRSAARLLGGIALLVALALALRLLDIYLVGSLPPGADAGFARTFVLVTMGMQGKYLEVFLMGVLASVIYIITVEKNGITQCWRARWAWGVLGVSVAIALWAIPNIRYGGTIFSPGQVWGFPVLVYPLVVGISYAALLLAIVWGNQVIRWVFETPVLRFIGLISFSLYLWHFPVLAMVPIFFSLSPLVRILCAIGVAYLSYQLVERPFLRRTRGRNDTQPHRARDASSVVLVGNRPTPAVAR